MFGLWHRYFGYEESLRKTLTSMEINKDLKISVFQDLEMQHFLFILVRNLGRQV
jgi:hypothetical protein